MDKWLDKLQDGAKFDGLTNKGFNYNSAWGGAFASGGGLKRSEDYGSKEHPYPSVSKGDFAGGGRSYPIPTRADAVDALKLAGLHGRADVKQKVYSKYPDLKKSQNGYDYKALGEGAVAAASLIPGPVGYGASVVGSGIDAYDAYKAYQRGDTNEAISEGVQSALGLIPLGSYLKPLAKGVEFTNKGAKIANLAKGIHALNTTADISDIINTRKQSGGKMNYYKSGLDFEPKTISQNGNVITDEMGQWKYPGEITRIPSNDITMRGVNYPVLGVSDTGDTKMMKPGKNYKFKGKSVTEYPQLQNGKDLEQLLNFTNKPDKRWLDNL